MKALSVNYNTPDLLDRMLDGFRAMYDIPLLIVDGSDERNFRRTEAVVAKYYDIEIHHFAYNIHHGPGMAYGISQITDERIVVIDTDIVFINPGVIERMDAELPADKYGIGDVQTIDARGFNAPRGTPYLHPALMLINRSVYERFPEPIKHGAPMIRAMEAIHRSGEDLLVSAPYMTNDFREKRKIYIAHDWQGTVKRTGGYHL